MVKVAYSQQYIYKLPPGHRFPIDKYQLVKEQLLYEGTLQANQLVDPGLCPEHIITHTHAAAYWHMAKNLALPAKMVRRIGLPLSPISVLRASNSVAGTLWASYHALEHGIGMNSAGGTHHAYMDKGEGFCLLNDIVVAARWLLKEKRVKQVLVVDLDVHQGNGTAALCAHEPAIFTFSVHGQHNYPLHKEQSNLDVALPDGTTDSAYLDMLTQKLPGLIDRLKPDLIYYLAGVDVLATDKLGRLALTRQGCLARDRFVFEQAIQRGIPVATAMGGGYSEKLADIVEAHANTFRQAVALYM